jgi:hypothetical protein
MDTIAAGVEISDGLRRRSHGRLPEPARGGNGVEQYINEIRTNVAKRRHMMRGARIKFSVDYAENEGTKNESHP